MAFSDDDDEAAAATKNRAVPLFATQRDRLCTKRADIDDDDVDGDENCRVVALRSVADLDDDDDDDDDANVEVDALVDIRRADCAHMVDTHDLIAFLFDKSVKSFSSKKRIYQNVNYITKTSRRRRRRLHFVDQLHPVLDDQHTVIRNNTLRVKLDALNFRVLFMFHCHAHVVFGPRDRL